MKNIDFLPNAYRERNALRNARAWWGIVVLVFGTVILTTASVQYTWRRSVERQLEVLQPEFMTATQRDLELTRLHKQIQNASEAAALYTYLQHPWPRSQILAAIARPLPESVHLHEIHLGEELLPIVVADTKTSGKRRTTAGDKDAPKLSPEQQDLTALRQDCDSRQTIVQLSGLADDVHQLHLYVAELGKSPIIAAAQLKSLEAVTADDSLAASPLLPTAAPRSGTRFKVHLVMRPGYGQPGGPEPRASPKRSTTAQRAPAQPPTGGPL